jgi:hypothetical protein
VAWRKRKLVRKIRIQDNCEPRKELAVARKEMTHCAKMVRRKGNIIRNKWTRAKAERGIQKAQTRHEGRKRVKDLGGGQPRHLRKRDLKKLRLESMGNVDTIFRKTTRLESAKRIARSTVGIQKIRNWTLWRGRPLPKWKTKQQVEQEPVMQKHRPKPLETERE